MSLSIWRGESVTALFATLRCYARWQCFASRAACGTWHSWSKSMQVDGLLFPLHVDGVLLVLLVLLIYFNLICILTSTVGH